MTIHRSTIDKIETKRLPPRIGPTIAAWHHTVSSCAKCDISSFCKHKVTHSVYIPNQSIRRIDILFIGEAPGASEYNEQEPFIGPSGQVLRDIIKEAVPTDLSYCLTNSILCTPFTDASLYNIRQPSLSEVQECRGHIARLCKLIRPRYIILLGRVAQKTYKQMGIPTKALELPHPSHIMQSKKYHYEFDKAVLQIQEYLGCTTDLHNE